jgi:hypothetical protein
MQAGRRSNVAPGIVALLHREPYADLTMQQFNESRLDPRVFMPSIKPHHREDCSDNFA